MKGERLNYMASVLYLVVIDNNIMLKSWMLGEKERLTSSPRPRLLRSCVECFFMKKFASIVL